MRIWLIGAEQAGATILRQLKKNREIEVVVSDTIDRPRAVVDQVIAKVDFVETVTPANINQLSRRIRPDLILIDHSATQRALSRVTGGMAFAESIQDEIASACDIPCLVL